MVGHAAALPQRDVREALHVAVLLRVLLVETQLFLPREVAAPPVRIEPPQSVRGRHHVRSYDHGDFLVHRRPEVLHADAGNFTGIVQQDLPRNNSRSRQTRSRRGAVLYLESLNWSPAYVVEVDFKRFQGDRQASLDAGRQGPPGESLYPGVFPVSFLQRPPAGVLVERQKVLVKSSSIATNCGVKTSRPQREFDLHFAGVDLVFSQHVERETYALFG